MSLFPSASVITLRRALSRPTSPLPTLTRAKSKSKDKAPAPAPKQKTGSGPPSDLPGDNQTEAIRRVRCLLSSSYPVLLARHPYPFPLSERLKFETRNHGRTRAWQLTGVTWFPLSLALALFSCAWLAILAQHQHQPDLPATRLVIDPSSCLVLSPHRSSTLRHNPNAPPILGAHPVPTVLRSSPSLFPPQKLMRLSREPIIFTVNWPTTPVNAPFNTNSTLSLRRARN